MQIYIQAVEDQTYIYVTPAAPGSTQLFGPLAAGTGVTIERGPLSDAAMLNVTLDESDPVPVNGAYTFQILTQDQARTLGLIT